MLLRYTRLRQAAFFLVVAGFCLLIGFGPQKHIKPIWFDIGVLSLIAFYYGTWKWLTPKVLSERASLPDVERAKLEAKESEAAVKTLRLLKWWLFYLPFALLLALWETRHESWRARLAAIAMWVCFTSYALFLRYRLQRGARSHDERRFQSHAR